MNVMISRRKFIFSTALLIPLPGMLSGAEKFAGNYFLHGVASGDSLQDRVIIWTRISVSDPQVKVVNWEVSQDLKFKQLVATGRKVIAAKSDYTVKVDVKGLSAGNRYYYRFIYDGQVSSIGLTKTLPDSLNGGAFSMAVVSCNNWEDGYFNSFRFLADKEEVDLVLHLGDYIYEYGTGEYGNPESGRINLPRHEVLTLQDYRSRYAQYRTDPDLQVLHQRKPFYLIWDDHELANDAYDDGAKNHQENEGPWILRKQAAIRAYLEWMPVRAKNASQIRRKFEIGDDISLYLMDERTAGRTRQMESNEKGFGDSDRSLLGKSQFSWLAEELKTTKSTWKLIANQVMFSGYAVAEGFKLPKYNDWWLGYPFERAKIIDLLQKEVSGITIFLTGDHHESFVLAVNKEERFMDYTKPYTQKPIAWELLTPSITSKNGDRRKREEIIEFENMLADSNINPHLVFGDIKNHGYFIAQVSKTEFKATYFFVDNILSRSAKEYQASAFSIDAKTFELLKK